MGSAVLVGVGFVDIQDFSFEGAKRSDMECVELQGCLFADCHEWHFRSANVQIIALPSCKRVDLLKFTNSVYRVKTFIMGSGCQK